VAWTEKRRIAHHTKTARGWRAGDVYDVRYRVRGRVRTETFPRAIDAENRRRQVEHDEMHGALIDPQGARITLEDWWAEWWPSTVHLRESTRARDEAYWRKRIKPALGHLRLDRIDRGVLRGWVSELRAAGLAPATVHKAAQIVSKVLRAAVDDGRLPGNPAERLELPRVERQEMRNLTPAEIDDLADAIDPRYRALVYLGAYGGLRLGEMVALRRDRVNVLTRKVDVATTLGEVRGRLVENPPKTRAGRRSVSIPPSVAKELERHLAEHPGAPGDYLFTAPEGGPVRAAGWRHRAWAPAIRRAGLEGLRPHDLRHTAVALWIAAGASPNEIAARAGHSSVVTVLDRYGHLLPGSEDRVDAKLDEIAAAARSPRDGDRATVSDLTARSG
jgi:integrase